MKGMDIFCASQASTSICLSHQAMDLPSQPSSSSSAQPLQLGGRAIDRHNPIIRDPRRVSFQATITPTLLAPCSSSQVPPINPIPYHQLQKPKSTPVDPSVKSAPPALDGDKKPGSDSTKKNKKKKKKKNRSSISVDGNQSDYHPHRAPVTVRKSAQTLTDFITPPGSSRYLLGDPGPSDGISDNDDPVLGLVPVPVPHQQQEKEDKSYVLAAASKHSSSSRFSKSSCDQVVVLRVSLHCKGCEGKLRHQNGRSDIVQHRLSGKEGDCCRGRDAAERAGKRLESEERPVLDLCAFRCGCSQLRPEQATERGVGFRYLGSKMLKSVDTVKVFRSHMAICVNEGVFILLGT